VKEDRTVCPCRLVLDMSDIDTSVVKCAELVVGASGGFQFRDTLGVEEFMKGCVVDVPRGGVGVGLYYGAEGCVDERGGIGIAYGTECPQVYMHSSTFEAQGEIVVEEVQMKKSHCIMTIQVETEKDFPFTLEAKGHIDGYGLGGIPSVGEFLYAMYTDDSGKCQISLPRQTDASLVLEVHDDSGVLKSFALGEYVAASGYDWTEENLRDITVSLDYSLTRVQISVAGWREEFVFDVIV
jgi:hypothetical protein